MSKLIEVVDLKDSKGYPIGRRYKYACDMCGKDVFRAIRINYRRVLCFGCRNSYVKMRKLENEANMKPEGE